MADVSMPPPTAPATPIAAISAIPIVPVSVVPTVLVSAIHTASIFMGPGEFLGSSLIFFLASLLLLTYGSSLGPLPIVPSQFKAVVLPRFQTPWARP